MFEKMFDRTLKRWLFKRDAGRWCTNHLRLYAYTYLWTEEKRTALKIEVRYYPGGAAYAARYEDKTGIVLLSTSIPLYSIIEEATHQESRKLQEENSQKVMEAIEKEPIGSDYKTHVTSTARVPLGSVLVVTANRISTEYEADIPERSGSPPVGRGKSYREALGDWLLNNQDYVGISITQKPKNKLKEELPLKTTTKTKSAT